MSKPPEIVIIEDDDDDDVMNAEVAAATAIHHHHHNGINNTIIQHDILSATAAAAVASHTLIPDKQKHAPKQERPVVTVPNKAVGMSPFRINKHNNPNNNSNNTNAYVGYKNDTKNSNNDYEEDDADDEDDEDQEQLPITHLPQPNYEKQFKSIILKPLHSILESLKQDEVLSIVRMHLFVIMQGIYLEARRIYVDQNKLLQNGDSSNSSVDKQNGKMHPTSLIGKTNQDFDENYFLNAPGLYIHNEENVFEYNMAECTFVDPDAEEITKTKLLPQVMKILLKLGEGGGDRKYTFGVDTYSLSITAEDLIACIMLDFVGMVTKILSLVETMEEKMNDQSHQNGCSNTSSSSVFDDDDDDDDDINMKASKKRRVENSEQSNINGVEHENQSQGQSPIIKTKPMPNILDYVGEEMLSVFIKVLGSEACCAGYNQSLLDMRRDGSNSETSVEDAVYLYLPPFFKSHLFDTNNIPVDNDVKIFEDNGSDENQDDCIMRGNQLKDDYLSALRTGEWRKYYLLYHSSDATRDLHQNIQGSSSNNETRDAPLQFDNLFMSRHLVAMARYFVQGEGLVNLNKILLDSLDSCPNSIFTRVDFDILQSVISIFQIISFISSYCIDSQSQNVDCLKVTSVKRVLEEFKGISQQFIGQSIFRIHDFTQQEQRKLLVIIRTLEERSLTPLEFTRLSESPLYLTSTFSSYFNFNTKESHEMKLTVLWRLLTGRNPGEDVGSPSTSTTPSLQCQISALNEINSWVKNLENQVQSYRDQYIKMCNSSDDSIYPEMNPETSANATISNSRHVTNNYAVAALKQSDPIIVSDEMPRLIQSDNLNNDFLDEAKKDNDSTEVCCHSNDSISSTNSDNDVKMAENDHDRNAANGIDKPISSKRGDVSHNLLQESEAEFYDVLELLKSKYNVMSHLFSPLGIHTELLKRSLPLLDVLSRNGILKEEDLKLIWDITGFSARAKDNDFHVHSSVTSTVFDLLLGLVNNNNGWMALNGDMIAHYENFFSEVMDFHRWTPQSLYLVETVAHRSIDLTIYKVLAGKDYNIKSISMPAGFNLLWLLSQDNRTESNDSKMGTNADIALGALTRVIESVVTKCHQSKMNTELSDGENNVQFSQREKTMLYIMQKIQTAIIVRVIESIKSSNQSTTNTTNIRILNHLLMRLPTSLKTESSLNHVNNEKDGSNLILTVEDIVNYDDLLSVFVDEMVSYSVRIKGDLTKNKEGNYDLSAALVSNLYTHKDCVFYRHQLFQLYVSRCFDVSTICSDRSPQEPVKMATIENVGLVEEDSDQQSQVKIVNDDEISRETLDSNDAENSLFPTQDQISTLWKYFVADEGLSIVDCVLEMFYNLLTSIVLKGSTQILKWRKQLASILYPLCLQLDSSTMSATMYKLLIYCVGHQNAFCGNFHTISHRLDKKKAKRYEDKICVMSNILLGLSYSAEPSTCSSSLYLSGRPIIEQVSNYSIIGLDKLWTIMLESCDDDVANLAMTYIAILYNFPHLSSEQSCVEMFTEQVTFAKHCITELNTGIKSRKRQTRLLHLMKLFVQHSTNAEENRLKFSHGSFSEKINTLEVESVITVNSPFSLFVQVMNGPKLTIYCPLGERTKVSFLRDSISRHLYQDFRLAFSGSELKQNSATLAAHNITADAVVFCCLRLSTKHVQQSDAVHIVEPLNEDCNSDESDIPQKSQHLNGEDLCGFRHPLEPKPLMTPGIAELLGENCLNKLFQLLSSWKYDQQEREVCHLKALVWDLLQSLPTKPSVRDGISDIFYTHKLQEIHFEQFLPYPDVQGTKNSSLFRMLYSLQVVERMFLHVKESYTLSKNPNKSYTDHRKRKTVDKEESDCIVVDDVLKISHRTGNQEKIKTVVVIDDDNNENRHIRQVIDENVLADDDVHMAKKEIAPHQVVENFVKNGGLKHILKLFLCFDDSCFVTSANGNQYNHELSSLIVTCANKLIYLLISVTSLDDGYFQITLGSTETCALVINQLLKMIPWAVAFQLSSNGTYSQSSKYITGGWSSAEIGSALVLHCLKFMKLIAAKISCTSMQLKMNIKREVITSAMKSSIIHSPSNVVRSVALPVFKQLIYLIEAEGNRKRLKTSKPKNEDLNSFHLHSLSLLVSLLPVGRETPPNTSFDQNAISTRCYVLFDFVTSYISNAFSNLSPDSRAKASRIIIESLHKMRVQSFCHEVLHEPPDTSGIDELGNLLFWVILEIKILASNKFHSVETYVEGLISILQSVVLALQTNELKVALAKLYVSEGQTLLQLLFKSATYIQEKHKNRTKLYCTAPSLRKKLLDFLLVLCTGAQENEISLLTLLSTHLYSTTPRIDLERDWSLDPVLKQKGFTGHVGMKNQGATCYLNSLLQQFFHTNAFRSGLMSCEIGSKETSSEASEEGRLLFELQRLFGNLLMSEKRDFDTMDLVKTIKGYDGNTIRPGEQQDVDEFFNLFCTRLETALKESPQNRLLHDVFGGQISHLITCKTCQKSSERVEDFLSISLDVKGKHNIYESLQSYIRGEVLDGSNKYFCSHCDAKRDSIKRCCLKTLPNVLIFHLKRFDFDLEQLRKIKVNDRFEYPLDLNMKHFTKEGLNDLNKSELDWREDGYYQYALRGVVVHTGTADSGHYYSLSHVRENDSSQLNGQTTEGSWYCFNDSIVSPFDLSTLENTTFGGVNETNYRQMKRNDLSKSYSAYLLIYDRVDQYKFDEQLVENPKKSVLTPSKTVSNPWEDEIIEQNLRHAKDQVIFSLDYGRFVTDICSAAVEGTETDLTLKAIETMSYHLIDNIIHVRDRANEIENQFFLLTSWYEKSEISCRWFLTLLRTSHRRWLDQIFFHCYKPEIRISFVKLLGVIFQKLAPLERTKYYDGANTEETNSYAFDADGDISVFTSNGTKSHKETLTRIEYWKSRSILALFIGTLINMLDKCRGYWRRFDQLFECLTKFADCGQEEAIFLIRSGLILRLIDIYQGDKINVSPSFIIRPPKSHLESNNDVKLQPKHKIGEKDRRPNYLPLLSLFGVLIRSGNLRDENDGDISDSDSSFEENESSNSEKCNEYERNIFLTKNCMQSLHVSNLTFDLPKRDCYLATNKDMMEMMLSELCMYHVHKDFEEHQKKLTLTIGKISCQICFNNLAKTLMVCALAQRIIKERKASESNVAVQVLSSLVHINDKHLHQRIDAVSAAFFEGISSNATYERELLVILEAIHQQLLMRSPGSQGSKNEVYFHSILLDNLDKFTSLFGRNIANTAKHRILCIIKSLLPIKTRNVDIENKECTSVKTILRAYSGHELNDHALIVSPTSSDSDKKQTKYVEHETIKDKIFAALKNLYMSVADAISFQSSQTRNDYIANGILNTSHIIESSTFFEYYATLRECLTDAKWRDRLDCDDDNWICNLTENIMPHFWDLDNGGRNQHRCPADLLKGEIIRLFERFAQLDPKQFLHAILDKHQSSPTDSTDPEISTNGNNDPVTKMMEVFITTGNNFDYNNTYMVHFYSLLSLLADNDKSFHKGVLTHENWKWALRSFVLNRNIAQRGQLYNVILRNTLKYVEDNERFRKSIYKLLLDSFLQHDHSNTAVLKLLSAIFESERIQNGEDDALDCIDSFVFGDCGGMSKISSLTKNLFEQTSKDFSDDLANIEILVEDLYHGIHCMFIIIESLEDEDIMKVMKESWPEVDEMNSIFMQIITRTDDEWKDCYKDSIKAEKLVRKTVLISRDLQCRLITASTSNSAGRRQ